MKDLTELADFLQEDSNKAAFSEAIKGMGFFSKDDLDSEVQGLKNKNTQLILAEKKLKEKLSDTQKILDEIDIEEYKTLKESGNKVKGSDTDIDKLRRELKTLQSKSEQAEQEKAGILNKYQEQLRKTALSSALDENGFDSIHKDILISAFQGRAEIDEDTVFINGGDSLGLLPANEFFKKYASTDIGKSYLKQPSNSGAGSRSFSGGGKGSISRSEFDKLNPIEQREVLKNYTLND